MQKQKKPFSLMAFIRPHQAGFITSTVLAILSVASGMVPYFAVARDGQLLISRKAFSIYLTWGVALIAYLLKSILQDFYPVLPRGHFPCAVGVAAGCGG
ncbi:MAG: hypothetical protein ACLRJV_14795 [Eubacteriales bacterium]